MERPEDPRAIDSKAIVLETDDVQALLDELAAKGTEIVWRDIGGIGAILDSEGNLMTIFPRQQPSAGSPSSAR